jgi:2-polyprenyl-6-methoxyphenol hydroxylase-like FAD-dependent oxidoreductase
MSNDDDALIVGARCAGASLATMLARSGMSVLMVDAAAAGSDQVLSTHTIHPPGCDVLDELDVGAAVRAISPLSTTLRLQQDDVFLDLVHEAGRGELCPRRDRLDGLLQEAAAQAGAEFQDHCRVTDLVWEGDRVVGARMLREGREVTVRAGLVVGADGRNSTVADLVAAPEYFGYDGPRFAYWAYWNAPTLWREDADYAAFDFYAGQQGLSSHFIFQTDHDQLLMASVPPLAELGSWRDDPRAQYITDLRGDPVLGPLTDGAEPDGQIRGVLKLRYFFRQSAGAGWALLGDAGHHKDPHLGDGITDALLQARELAGAIREGSERALERYWRARDVDYYELFRFAGDQGNARPVSALDRLFFSHVGAEARLLDRLRDTVERRRSPNDVVSPPTMLGWLARAALRADVRPVADFLVQARRIVQIQRDLSQLKKTLAHVEPAA